jgi:hypothetical protein
MILIEFLSDARGIDMVFRRTSAAVSLATGELRRAESKNFRVTILIDCTPDRD